ncbi:helix-turn-helix domain-containing protein [Streptomyces sp. NP-1717]|uniref:helix-turn-helix domain-containing protein n=1 Tax=unclassified Streptomyces TaxID=2593676 RepID=UPI001F5C167B|nr:helix-turn-helix domain-containing protein [Streptomyces sp. NP-1717]MCI3225399.1 helix-turn-helix domain-containing protein [Streptomyces sp. NP-1717]WTA71532.1 helix-turn-helix domain-containing protein [Streptomyces sp. NBC_00838]
MDSFGRLVRQLREEAGLSLAALAARSDVSKSHIGNLESGARQPTPAVARALDTALRTDGFLLAVAAGADPVRRRTMLTGVGLALGAKAAPPGVNSLAEYLRQALVASLGATVDDWYEIAEEHGRDYMTVSAPELQTRLLGDLAALRAALPEDGRLWAVVCRLSALEAMTLTSLGDKRAAARWWRTARLAGSQSGDVSVRSWLQGRAAFRAAHEEAEPLSVLSMAEDVEAAEAHAARAWAFARLGDRGAATAAISSAHRALDRLPVTSQPTMYQMPTWRLGLAESRVFALLGDTRSMSSALADVPPDMGEWVAQREICIALAESVSGDLPSGLARADAALAGLPEVRQVSVVRSLAREVALVGRGE